MKKFHLFFLRTSVFIILTLSLLIGCSIDYGDVDVKRVVDGDTLELADGRFVRYIGIDCPELKKRVASGWVDVNEPFALEAQRFNEKKTLSSTVRSR